MLTSKKILMFVCFYLFWGFFVCLFSPTFLKGKCFIQNAWIAIKITLATSGKCDACR